MKRAARTPTASAESRKSFSIASGIRPSRRASAESSTKARLAAPAASSPLPAMVHSIAGLMQQAGTGLVKSPRPLSPATFMHRSAGPRIITPITSFPTGPPAWPRMPSSARISSTAGAAAGAVSPRSRRAGRGVNRTAQPCGRRLCLSTGPGPSQRKPLKRLKRLRKFRALKLYPRSSPSAARSRWRSAST